MSNRLYIPTTTLNFDNILSSESISPKSFYSKREFGFSRWFEVDENNNDDVILLYDIPMGFSRPKSDMEDHPLLIEITANDIINSTLEKIGDGVYSCAKTIYINPWNTNFIFQNERDKLTTLSLSDSSLETKVVRLYSKRMIVLNFPEKYKPLKKIIGHKLNTLAIKNDIETNKFKGFLYGYYVGAILSTSKTDVHQLILLKELRNVLAAIISNINGQPSSYQTNMVISLTSELNNYDQHIRSLRQFISSDKEYNDVIKYLKNNDIIKDRFDGNLILQSLNNINVNKTDNIHAIEYINIAIATFENEIERNRSLLLPDCGEAIISDQRLMVVNSNSFQSDIERKLFITWINEIFISPEYNSKINYYRETLTDNLTVRAKELLLDQWNTSEIRIGMNKLRRHLRGEEFDLKWNNGLISSLAAVIANGGDWRKILAFMQLKGMNDYRLAFSMYGMLMGFANLTQDFTDIILNRDKTYVADVYKEFYGQLFGTPINSESKPNQRKEENITHKHVSDISEIPNETTQSLNNSQHELRTDNTPSTVDIEVRQRLEAAIKSGVKADAKKGDAIIAKLIANNGNWQSTIDEIESDEKLKLGKKTIKSIYSEFGISMSQDSKLSAKATKESSNKKSKRGESSGEINLFSSPSSQLSDSVLLWSDDGLWSNIQLLFDDKYKARVKEDVLWFQKEFKKGDQSAYYSKARRDNDSIIGTFEKYLKKKEYVNEQTLKRIIEKIKSIYK